MLKFQSGWEERPIAFTLVMFLILWLLLGRKSYDLSNSLGVPFGFHCGRVPWFTRGTRQQHTMYGGCNSPREIVQLFVKREMEARGLETYQLSSETRSTTLQSNRSIISGQCICCWIYWQASKSACSSSIIFFLSHQQHRSWARALFFEYYRYYHLYWPTSCCQPGKCCLLMGMSHNYLWC